MQVQVFDASDLHWKTGRFYSWLCIYWLTADLKVENENASGFPH